MFENVKCGPFNVLTWYRHRRQVTRVNRIMTVMYFMNDNLLFFSQLALEASSCLYRIAYIIEMIKENTKLMRHPQIKYTSLQTHIRTQIHTH
mgnify:CR=1 FL=1